MTAFSSRRLRSLKPISLAVITGICSLSSAAQDNSVAPCPANEEGKITDCTAAEPPAAAPSPHPLDWVSGRHVPRELRDERCLDCNGRYIDPSMEAASDTAGENDDIVARAGSTEIRGNTVFLTDGVEVKQGYRQLRSEQATFVRDKRYGELEGDISLREPGLLLRGERAEVFTETGEARVENSQFVLHQQHLRGTAEALNRDDSGLLHVHGGKLSFCAPDEDEWSIRANELELDVEEGLGTARGARIDVGGVPVFYFPWMRFPIDDRRRTGFLWPDIGSDTRGGLDMQVPVYFNLAPNYDLLYSPRYIQERGVNHEAKARYLHPLIGSWTVGGAFMSNDERYEREYPEDRNHDRWLAVVKHDGLFEQRWRSRVDYSRASDVNYMKDLETSSLNSKRRTALLQLASLDYLGDEWMATVELQQFQTLADDINNDYKKLPQITARSRPKGTPFRLDPILLAQYSSFDTDTSRVTGDRLFLEAGATYPMLWNYGFLNSTAKYRQLDYELNKHPRFEDTSPSAGAPLLSVDSGLYFDRQTGFMDRGLLQTLEPRLYYLYSEFEEQVDQPDFDSAELTFTYNQLFRETRFSGRDRIDDADQLSVGITTRFIDEEDGREEFSASLGQIFYFKDREVRLNPDDPPLRAGGSEVAGELAFNPNTRLTLRTSLVFDPYRNRMNSGNLQTSYAPEDGRLFSVGYSYRRPLTLVSEQLPTEELHLSSYYPVNRRWAVFAAVNYSVLAHTSVEDMFGVEYDTCCWKVRLLHLRYYDTVPGQRNPDFNDPELQREDSTQIQIVLKGMGGFGSRATSIMKDMIRGFTDREY